MNKKKIIIDTDPGGDDTLAITMLLNEPSVEILGIATTYGNVSLEKTTANALRILDYFERPDIPVIKGASQPLIGKGLTAESFHGNDGLGDISLPYSKRLPEKQNVIEFYREKIEENKNNIDLIALGPLTNIAKLFITYPFIISKINNLYIMGGTFKTPAVTKFQEFNFYNDPLAVKIILNSSVRKYIVPLDVTDKVSYDESQILSLRENNTKGTKLLYDISRFWKENLSKKEGFIPWDAVGVGMFLRPELYQFSNIALDIRLDQPATVGKLISKKNIVKTTFLAKDIKVKAFLEYFKKML